jgi:hypothetical protein
VGHTLDNGKVRWGNIGTPCVEDTQVANETCSPLHHGCREQTASAEEEEQEQTARGANHQLTHAHAQWGWHKAATSEDEHNEATQRTDPPSTGEADE